MRSSLQRCDGVHRPLFPFNPAGRLGRSHRAPKNWQLPFRTAANKKPTAPQSGGSVRSSVDRYGSNVFTTLFAAVPAHWESGNSKSRRHRYVNRSRRSIIRFYVWISRIDHVSLSQITRRAVLVRCCNFRAVWMFRRKTGRENRRITTARNSAARNHQRHLGRIWPLSRICRQRRWDENAAAPARSNPHSKGAIVPKLSARDLPPGYCSKSQP